MSHLGLEHLPGLLGHELRNPLASALTNATLLRELLDVDDPRTAIAERTLEDLDRVSALVEGWLAMARGQQPKRESLRVGPFLAQVAARNQAELVCLGENRLLEGHAELLGRALDNLISNARQAGATQVRIAAQSLHDCLTVHVEDDGSGITAAQAQHLFEPGWSGHGGTGLGLHAVQATIVAHGGAIRWQPLAQGTRFSISLPLAQQAAALA